MGVTSSISQHPPYFERTSNVLTFRPTAISDLQRQLFICIILGLGSVKTIFGPSAAARTG